MIIRNSAHCLVCDEELESLHVHDLAQCSCGNLAVDGGSEYLRRLSASEDWVETSVTEEDE